MHDGSMSGLRESEGDVRGEDSGMESQECMHSIVTARG